MQGERFRLERKALGAEWEQAQPRRGAFLPITRPIRGAVLET